MDAQPGQQGAHHVVHEARDDARALLQDGDALGPAPSEQENHDLAEGGKREAGGKKCEVEGGRANGHRASSGRKKITAER